MKVAITSPQAPDAIGPYSQATRAGGFLYLSGQIALDPLTGALIPGDVGAQTERVMANLCAVLAAASLSFDDVVRATIYLVDLANFAKVNEIYGRSFRPPYPARSTVQVSALPRGAQVEIELLALVGA